MLQTTTPLRTTEICSMQSTTSNLDTTILLMGHLEGLLCGGPPLYVQQSVAFHTEDNLEGGS